MKTLVIHMKDYTTRFLSDIYSDKDWTVITTNVSKSLLKSQIKAHDRIIMLGHGTEDGLIRVSTDGSYNGFVIDSKLVYLLRDKHCVCIWCNADQFVTKYGLTGFYTGMIVSDVEESYCFSVPSSYDDIEKSNILFATAIKEAIDRDDMLGITKSIYESDKNNIILFNKNNLYETESN